MKTIFDLIKSYVLLAVGILLPGAFASGQTISRTNQDSIISLATNATRNYTYSNSSSGLSVVVNVTMTPYSQSNASPAFTLLDFYGGGPPVHLGADSGLGSGDGNWFDSYEGVNFAASLVSASAGIITNSIQFGIVGLGIRGNGANVSWSSPAVTNTFNAPNESLYSLDNTTAKLAGNPYSGRLRTIHAGDQYQLSDFGALAGQSVLFKLTFLEGTGAPIVTVNPADQHGCTGNSVSFTAAAAGDPNPTLQWQVKTNGGATFVNIAGATSATLLLTPALSDGGNQYQAAFTNLKGVATTTPATLTMNTPPSTPVISVASTNISAVSTNTAVAPPGAAAYFWTISNGSIVGSSGTQTLTYVAGTLGVTTLALTIGNASGCTASSVTNLAIGGLPGVAVGAGVYVSDDSNLIGQFDSNGAGTKFAYAPSAPGGLAFDQAGNLYVANYLDGTVERFSTNGAGSVFATGLNSPFAIAFDGAGNLYATSGNNTVSKLTTNGTASVFIDSGLDGPNGIAFDRAGNLYVANYSGKNVTKFPPTGGRSIFATVTNAAGLAFDAAGNLYAADSDDGLIWKFDANGNGSLFASNKLSYPIGLAFDVAGNLYAANDGDGTVAKFAPDGTGVLLKAQGLSGGEFVAAWPIPQQLIPPAPASLSAARFSNSHFQFTTGGTGGANYVVQAATNLASPVWISIATNAAPFDFLDANAAAYSNRFYRVLSK